MPRIIPPQKTPAQLAADPALTSTYAARSIQRGTVPALSYGSHLKKSRILLNAAKHRPFNITVIGDSIAAGYAANGNTTSPIDATTRLRGWTHQLGTKLNARLGTGDPGEGVILMADPRVTSSGTQQIGSIGITRATPGGLRLDAATDTVTLTLTEACTEIWIHGYWAANASCSAFDYNLDGAGYVTATGFPSGTDQDYTIKLTGLSNTTHTLVIRGVDTKVVDIAGYSVFATSPAVGGVTVNRATQGGGYLDTVIYLTTEPGGVNPRSNRLTLGRTSTDLCVVAFGANESSTTGEGTGHTPADFLTRVTDFVTYATGTFGCDVLLLSTGRRQNGISSYGQEAFYDVHEQVAAANSRCAHIDLARPWGTWTAANGDALMYDSVHPTLAGHGDIADIVAGALLGPM